jgi:SAM-dependent methyltransferase
VHFVDPMPSEAEIVGFYAEQMEPNEWEIEHYVHVRSEEAVAWNRFAERLTRLNGGPGRMLEVGCAAGHLLAGAIDHGWQVMGVEASPKFSAETQRRGLPVHAGVLANLPADDVGYDLVVMTDVLEHLRDPVADLVLCHRRLKPGGLLVVATCDIGSFAARYYRLKWRQLVISHTFYWSKASLRIALDRSGFDTLDLSSMRYWDPDPQLERSRWLREFTKLAARKTLQVSWMRLAQHSRALRSAHGHLTRGRLDFERLEHKVGDQAVMADVALIVGRSRSSAPAVT